MNHMPSLVRRSKLSASSTTTSEGGTQQAGCADDSTAAEGQVETDARLMMRSRRAHIEAGHRQGQYARAREPATSAVVSAPIPFRMTTRPVVDSASSCLLTLPAAKGEMSVQKYLAGL